MNREAVIQTLRSSDPDIDLAMVCGTLIKNKVGHRGYGVEQRFDAAQPLSTPGRIFMIPRSSVSVQICETECVWGRSGRNDDTSSWRVARFRSWRAHPILGEGKRGHVPQGD